jgi:hypothetical protein
MYAGDAKKESRMAVILSNLVVSGEILCPWGGPRIIFRPKPSSTKSRPSLLLDLAADESRQ